MPVGSKDKDYTQGIKESYDPALERLRVDALINDGVDALVINADGSINVNATIGSIALPTGASTSALQISGNASLVSIDSKLTSPITVVSTGSSTVSGTVTTNQNGLANIQTTQYTVGTSAVQLTPSPLSGRKSLSVKVQTTASVAAVYIGNSSGVTTSTGYPLFNGDQLQIDLTAANSLYAIGSATGQLVYVLEIG